MPTSPVCIMVKDTSWLPPICACARVTKWDNYGIDLLKSKDLTNWTSVTFDFRKGMQNFWVAATATSPYKDWSTINRVWAPQIF